MISIRKMKVGDIPSLMRILELEGWNQTEADWRFLIKNYPAHCFCAVEGDTVVASATAANYNNQIAWIGMVLVDRNYRGQKIATRLMESVKDSLSCCEFIGLDATPAGKSVYEKLGFSGTIAIKRMRNDKAEFKDDRHVDISAITLADIPELISLDAKAFGTTRPELIEQLLKENDELCVKFMGKGIISGSCLVRKGNRYNHIGPLVAKNSTIAKKLLGCCCSNLSGKPIIMDIVDANSDFVDFASTMGFSEQRSFLRMFIGKAPYQSLCKTSCAVAGPEFG